MSLRPAKRERIPMNQRVLTEKDRERAFAEPQAFGPTLALQRAEETLQERVAHVERENESLQAQLEAARAELAEAQREQRPGSPQATLQIETLMSDLAARDQELETLRALSKKAEGEGGASNLVFLDPNRVIDKLPSDRFEQSFSENELRGLAEDIQRRGQDTPILVRATKNPDGETTYEIAAGKRRVAACKLLGITVLARVREMTEPEMLAARFAENYHRQDLSPFERARYFATTMEMSGLTAGEVADIYGIDRTTVQHHLLLNQIPPAVINTFRDPRKISRRKATELVEVLIKDPSASTRVIESLHQFHTDIDAGRKDDREEILVALAAARRQPLAALTSRRSPSRPLMAGTKQIGSAAFVQGRWTIRFDASINDEQFAVLTAKLAEAFDEAPQSVNREATQ